MNIWYIVAKHTAGNRGYIDSVHLVLPQLELLHEASGDGDTADLL